MGFIRKFLIWALLIPALILGLLVLGPQAAGLSVCTVREDSMRDMASGSLLYVREVDPRALDTGDVITYCLQPSRFRHNVRCLVLLLVQSKP